MPKSGHWQIFVPGVNKYPIEKAKKWAYKSYAQAKAQVDKERVKDIKARLPRKTADYAVAMTFGKWRLLGPVGEDAKSPLDKVLDLLKPVIKPGQWREFKKQFRKKLIQQFEIIGWFNYNPDRIAKVNSRINQLISEFISKDVTARLDFVAHPGTAESYYSRRLVALRDKIYGHLTGKPLNIGKSQQPPTSKIPLQMDMHLDLGVRIAGIGSTVRLD